MQARTRNLASRALRAQVLADVRGMLARFSASYAIQHGVAKGENREEILREHLKSHLPRRFQVGTGLVVDSKGNSSGQHDIIIADALYSPLILPAAPNAIFPLESVHCVIEVRSRFVHTLEKEFGAIADRFRKLTRLKHSTGVVRYTPPTKFVAHAKPNIKTEQLCRDILAWQKPLYTLESDANADLIAMGAKPVTSDTASEWA